MYKINLAVDTTACVVIASSTKRDGTSGPKATMYYPRTSKVTLLDDGTFLTEGTDGRKLFCPTIHQGGKLTIERLE